MPEREGGPGWMGHAQYSYKSEPCSPGDALTPAQILEFRDRMHVAYYRRPEYRQRLLSKPELGQEALDNIEEWIRGIEHLPRKIVEEARRESRVTTTS